MISGIQSYHGGTPLSINMTSTLLIFSRVLRPNLVPNVSHSLSTTCDPNASCIVNEAALSAPANYTFGIEPHSILTFRNYVGAL